MVMQNITYHVMERCRYNLQTNCLNEDVFLLELPELKITERNGVASSPYFDGIKKNRFYYCCAMVIICLLSDHLFCKKVVENADDRVTAKLNCELKEWKKITGKDSKVVSRQQEKKMENFSIWQDIYNILYWTFSMVCFLAKHTLAIPLLSKFSFEDLNAPFASTCAPCDEYYIPLFHFKLNRLHTALYLHYIKLRSISNEVVAEESNALEDNEFQGWICTNSQRSCGVINEWEKMCFSVQLEYTLNDSMNNSRKNESSYMVIKIHSQEKDHKSFRHAFINLNSDGEYHMKIGYENPLQAQDLCYKDSFIYIMFEWNIENKVEQNLDCVNLIGNDDCTDVHSLTGDGNFNDIRPYVVLCYHSTQHFFILENKGEKPAKPETHVIKKWCQPSILLSFPFHKKYKMMIENLKQFCSLPNRHHNSLASKRPVTRVTKKSDESLTICVCHDDCWVESRQTSTDSQAKILQDKSEEKYMKSLYYPTQDDKVDTLKDIVKRCLIQLFMKCDTELDKKKNPCLVDKYNRPSNDTKFSEYDDSKEDSIFVSLLPKYLSTFDHEESSYRIFQEINENHKLEQPPCFDPLNERDRIITLSNLRVAGCSIRDVAKAGFYLLPDSSVICAWCGMKFHFENFQPSDPHHPRWHDLLCNGSNSKRTQGDGRISDNERDPPGQRSAYIPSGDVREESYRLSTFSNYPVSSSLSKIRLAKSGFYYTGYFDRVKCFACGRSVDNWSVGDNPGDTRWHKSNCPIAQGMESGNISSQLPQYHSSSPSARSHNQVYPQDLSETSQSGLHFSRLQQVRTNPGNASANQPQRRWQMANVISTDHRRFLGNLYLNRELDRLASFARWPSSRPTVSPESLAKAGFFYLGDMDRTQCFSCGGVLRNWTVNDNAFEEHRSNFSQCPFMCGSETRNVPVPTQPETQIERERNFPCRFPSNPHMRSEATRLDTFDQRWPIGRTAATPAEIAQAGYFFLGERDRVKCWYCNGGLQNWDYEDSPWIEHAKWFPNCQFLLRVKGQHFVHRHLRLHANLQRPIIAKQDGSLLDQPSPRQSLPSSPVTTRTHDIPPSEPSENVHASTPVIIDPMEELRKKDEMIQNIMKNSESVKSILLMGYDAKIVESIVEDKVSANPGVENIEISMSELLDDVMRKEEEEKQKQEIQRSAAAGASAAVSTPESGLHPTFSEFGSSGWPSTSTSSPSGSGKYKALFYGDNDEEDDDDIEMYGSSSPVSSSAGRQPFGSQDDKTVKETLAKMEEESLCKICFTNKADMVFLPCSHMCCCMECTQAIRQCPLCRKIIETAIKTYSA